MPPLNATAYDRKTEMKVKSEHTPGHMYAWVGARLLLGFVFLWAFLDKSFGLSYSTKPASAWIRGGSPTNGFLSHTTGTFSGFFHAIAGNVVTDWLFMLALLGIGLALILGVGMRIAAVSGALLMLMMYAAATVGVAATSNPAVDDHLVYAAVLIGLAMVNAGSVLGLGKYWQSLSFVQKNRYLA